MIGSEGRLCITTYIAGRISSPALMIPPRIFPKFKAPDSELESEYMSGPLVNPLVVSEEDEADN